MLNPERNAQHREGSVLLHLSDTHFGTERPQVLEALVELAARQRPDRVVLSGDITQRARPAQFRAARAFADRLAAPVLAIPGNHDMALLDLWTRFTRPYARYTEAFGSALEPVQESPEWLLVGVNTTRTWRHRHGEVAAAQIERVARLLRAAGPQQLRVVVVHQPMGVTEARERPHLLRGHRQALQAWAAAGADLLLGGHIHLPYTLPMETASRRLWVVQAGTAISQRTRPGWPNSVNILRWGGPPAVPSASSASLAPSESGQRPNEAERTCQIEQWDFAREQQAFVCKAVTTVQPDRP